MAIYNYRAINGAGGIVAGEAEGVGEKEVVALLISQGLSPVALVPKKTGSKTQKNKKVTRRDIVHFTNQLSALLNAKLPLARALQAAEQQSAGEMQVLIGELSRMVREGKPLSDALGDYPGHFPPLFCNMVRAGEVGGVLEQSLASVAEMLEKDEELKARVKGALTYPAVMLSVMCISVIILITFVVPRFSGVFADQGKALPAPTKALMAVSTLFQKGWWGMALLGFLAFTGIRQYARSQTGRAAIDRLKLSLPLLGPLVREVALARFSATLGTLLQSGVPVLEALEATRDVAGNTRIAGVLDQVRSELKGGKSLSQALAVHGDLFPSLVTGMVGTGEETGNLPDMLTSIGRYYTREADAKIKALTTMIEPVIILSMGVMVGFIIIAMLLPIFEMTTSVK